MENYLAFIMGIALLAMIVDLLCSAYPNMQRQVYRFFFASIYILFLIRYYYGPDIWTYVPHYEDIPTPLQLWNHPEEASYEWGYDMFCSLLHSLGLSYWGMTAVITTLYFAALACLFHSLPRFRLFAFATVILFDYNLIYAENRQCLAVALFIFMILCLQKRRYLFALLFAATTVLIHKSGFIPVGLTLIGTLLYRQRGSAMMYNILILVLMAMMLVPVTRIATPLLSILPLPESYIESAAHHLQLGRQFQTVALIYLAVLVWISIHNARHSTKYGWIAIEVLIGVIIIVAVYQYYFLLNRLRSYFTPFIVWYLVFLATDGKRAREIPYMALIRQSVAMLMIVYFANATYGYIRGAKQLHTPIARASTLFNLRHESPKQIRDRQMKLALRYWQEDYMKQNDNKL